MSHIEVGIRKEQSVPLPNGRLSVQNVKRSGVVSTLSAAVSRNGMLAANMFFRLAPNVVTGFEIGQLHTRYKAGQRRGNTHLNWYLAYLF